jgi:two-component system response regulator HydG
MHDIIVIEDDDILRDYLCEGLANAGHAVRGAVSGASGLAMLRARAADIVITDLVMDNGEGMETLIELRDAEPPPLLIAMSGNALYLEQSLKLGAQCGLLKPFTMAALLRAVDEPAQKWITRRARMKS